MSYKLSTIKVNCFLFCKFLIPLKIILIVGIFFSTVTLEIESFTSKWKGCLNVGLTCRDPLTFVKERPLAKYSYPVGLCLEENVWIKPLPSHWNRSRLSFLLTNTGPTTSNGLYLVNSNETRYQLIGDLSNLESQFWLIFDLYGRTTRISVWDYSEMTFKIPMSISVQGPNVVRVYEKCCSKSCLRFNNTRIFTIGPPGTGKSTLKNLLLNSR